MGWTGQGQGQACSWQGDSARLTDCATWLTGHGPTIGPMGPTGWTGLRPPPAMRDPAPAPRGGACIWAPLTLALCGQKKRDLPYSPENFCAGGWCFQKKRRGFVGMWAVIS